MYGPIYLGQNKFCSSEYLGLGKKVREEKSSNRQNDELFSSPIVFLNLFFGSYQTKCATYMADH